MCDTCWYNEYLGLNPQERKRRDLVVQYAESQGGPIEQYLREVYSRYWQKVEWRESFKRIREDLHLTHTDELKILADMARAIAPVLQAGFPDGASGLRLPERVGHL